MSRFTPSRLNGLQTLAGFLPHAGRDYQRLRNYDVPPHRNVSCLSPYLRHRMVTEEEVLRAAIDRHGAQAAEKFIQEVFWRTYWRGWLEQRPSVWTQYRVALDTCRNRISVESGLRAQWEAACTGQTGIACFDYWANELSTNGYLHNHARMWFASIWVFTLRLPWELGADFFMRHLLDGCAASNTLSWRWVAGLQTIGKNYAARADNIARFTHNRFQPKGLAVDPTPLMARPHPSASALPQPRQYDPEKPCAMLVSSDDLSMGWAIPQHVDACCFLASARQKSPWAVGELPVSFEHAALGDCRARYKEKLGDNISGPIDNAVELADWLACQRGRQIVFAYAPTGPTQDLIHQACAKLGAQSPQMFPQIRPYDLAAWPNAKAGYFKFRSKIPGLLAQID